MGSDTSLSAKYINHSDLYRLFEHVKAATRIIWTSWINFGNFFSCMGMWLPAMEAGVGEILGWPPVIWTARLALIIVVGGGAFVATLYMARFLRPKHLWRLFTAELPRFKDVSGTMKVLGQELAAHATLETAQNLEIAAFAQRLSVLEEQVRQLTALGANVLKASERGESR